MTNIFTFIVRAHKYLLNEWIDGWIHCPDECSSKQGIRRGNHVGPQGQSRGPPWEITWVCVSSWLSSRGVSSLGLSGEFRGHSLLGASCSLTSTELRVGRPLFPVPASQLCTGHLCSVCLSSNQLLCASLPVSSSPYACFHSWLCQETSKFHLFYFKWLNKAFSSGSSWLSMKCQWVNIGVLCLLSAISLVSFLHLSCLSSCFKFLS